MFLHYLYQFYNNQDHILLNKYFSTNVFDNSDFIQLLYTIISKIDIDYIKTVQWRSLDLVDLSKLVNSIENKINTETQLGDVAQDTLLESELVEVPEESLKYFDHSILQPISLKIQVDNNYMIIVSFIFCLETAL